MQNSNDVASLATFHLAKHLLSELTERGILPNKAAEKVVFMAMHDVGKGNTRAHREAQAMLKDMYQP